MPQVAQECVGNFLLGKETNVILEPKTLARFLYNFTVELKSEKLAESDLESILFFLTKLIASNVSKQSVLKDASKSLHGKIEAVAFQLASRVLHDGFNLGPEIITKIIETFDVLPKAGQVRKQIFKAVSPNETEPANAHVLELFEHGLDAVSILLSEFQDTNLIPFYMAMLKVIQGDSEDALKELVSKVGELPDPLPVIEKIAEVMGKVKVETVEFMSKMLFQSLIQQGALREAPDNVKQELELMLRGLVSSLVSVGLKENREAARSIFLTLKVLAKKRSEIWISEGLPVPERLPAMSKKVLYETLLFTSRITQVLLNKLDLRSVAEILELLKDGTTEKALKELPSKLATLPFMPELIEKIFGRAGMSQESKQFWGIIIFRVVFENLAPALNKKYPYLDLKGLRVNLEPVLSHMLLETAGRMTQEDILKIVNNIAEGKVTVSDMAFLRTYFGIESISKYVSQLLFNLYVQYDIISIKTHPAYTSFDLFSLDNLKLLRSRIGLFESKA